MQCRKPDCFFFYIELHVWCSSIWEINDLSVTSFANIFSCSVDCLFILFMVTFAVQKPLIRSHLFIFVFISITLGHRSKNVSLAFYVKEYSVYVSSRSFIVSDLTFRSLFHFEFIFVYGIRECYHCFLLSVALQFSLHHFLKRLHFLHSLKSGSLIPPALFCFIRFGLPRWRW